MYLKNIPFDWSIKSKPFKPSTGPYDPSPPIQLRCQTNKLPFHQKTQNIFSQQRLCYFHGTLIYIFHLALAAGDPLDIVNNEKMEVVVEEAHLSSRPSYGIFDPLKPSTGPYNPHEEMQKRSVHWSKAEGNKINQISLSITLLELRQVIKG